MKVINKSNRKSPINFDSQNMRQVILDFPKQFKVGMNSVEDLNLKIKKFSNIIICGMGGSALPGNVLKALNTNLNLTKLPIIIHRDYGLAKEAENHSLIFCISYSGNTEETISAFKEARRRKLNIVVIASGGKLINLAKKNKISFARVPFGVQPRCALGYQFSALYKILTELRLVKNLDREILNLEKFLKPKELESQGKLLAKKLLGGVPVVYSSSNFGLLAKIWKIKFNENSKVPSFFNFFPELNHNEMVGMGETKLKEAKRIFKFLILRDREQDSERNLKRMEIMAKILKQKGFEVMFINLEKLSKRPKEANFYLYFLLKIFSGILLGDWASYYLAIYQKTDPTPVNLVEEFKKKISK